MCRRADGQVVHVSLRGVDDSRFGLMTSLCLFAGGQDVIVSLRDVDDGGDGCNDVIVSLCRWPKCTRFSTRW